jgi:hypothetical protein
MLGDRKNGILKIFTKYQGWGLVQQNLQQQSFSQNQINTKKLHQSGSL